MTFWSRRGWTHSLACRIFFGVLGLLRFPSLASHIFFGVGLLSTLGVAAYYTYAIIDVTLDILYPGAAPPIHE